MENRKRIYRELSDETKKKISNSSKGKSKSSSHKAALSKSLVRYWESIPHKPKQVTMDDLIGKA